MAYNDIQWVTYQSLAHRAKHLPPYASTTNVFPLGQREYSHRHYRVNDDGTFDIYLGNRGVVDKVLAGDHLCEKNSEQMESYVFRSRIARIHPDNSIEFFHTRNGQSDLLVYNAMIRGAHIGRNVKHGGAVMYFGEGKKNAHPLFHGLRINLNDLSVHKSTEYVTYLPTLIRKEAKEYMKQFDEFYKTFHVLLEPLPFEAYPEIIVDLANEYPDAMRGIIKSASQVQTGDGLVPIRMIAGTELTDAIRDLVGKKRYADAAVMCMAFTEPWYMHRLYSTTDMTKLVNSYMYPPSRITHSVHKAVASSKHNLLKFNPTLFSYRSIEAGAPLVASKWGLNICLKSDNTPVVRV
jgi:hypothetical protein